MTVLDDLANLMVKRRRTSKSDDGLRTVVIPFVGAGASASAGLPDGSQLKAGIWEKLIKNVGDGADNVQCAIETLFRREAEDAFNHPAERPLTDLSLYQFASVLSGTKYGRDAIRDYIHEALPSDGGRPLSYELLAHLAKHDFIDDLVSLNFDTLLDHALVDELPDRLRVIDGSGDIPGTRARLREPKGTRLLVKPFGSVDVDFFRLRPEELQRYGEKSVWQFMLNHVFPDDGRTTIEVVLLLVGYAAAEPAFDHLLSDLRRARHVERVKVFSINRAAEMPSLDKLQGTNIVTSVEKAQIDADIGLSLLLQLLQRKHVATADDHSWIPVARHEIIAACFVGRRRIDSCSRFDTEIILQAVKGRGFFTIESIAELQRIPEPPDGAARRLKTLIETGILCLHEGGAIQQSEPTHLCADFELAISDDHGLAGLLLTQIGGDPNEVVSEWRAVDRRGRLDCEKHQTTLQEFVADRLTAIGKAPQIEVSQDVSPATRWMFRAARTLSSVPELQAWTSEFLSKALQANYVDITGVWVTGEWIFHQDGWAYEQFGKRLLRRTQNGSASIRVVLASFDEHMGTLRGQRARTINAELESVFNTAKTAPNTKGQPRTSECKVLNWWLHNRCLTLVRSGSSPSDLSRSEGVYFRQRHGSPLVAPVAVDHPDDCIVLEDLYRYYCRKAAGQGRRATAT